MNCSSYLALYLSTFDVSGSTLSCYLPGEFKTAGAACLFYPVERIDLPIDAVNSFSLRNNSSYRSLASS
jgi:hypothetical protein